MDTQVPTLRFSRRSKNRPDISSMENDDCDDDADSKRERFSLPSSSSIRRRNRRRSEKLRKEVNEGKRNYFGNKNENDNNSNNNNNNNNNNNSYNNHNNKGNSIRSLNSTLSDVRPRRRRARTSIGKHDKLTQYVSALRREYERDVNGSSLFLLSRSRRSSIDRQSVKSNRPKRSSTVKRLLLSTQNCGNCINGQRSPIERTDAYVLAHVSAFCSGEDAMALATTSHTIALSLAVTSAPLAAVERYALSQAHKRIERADPYNITLAIAEIADHSNATMLQCCLEKRVRAVCQLRSIKPHSLSDWLSLVVLGRLHNPINDKYFRREWPARLQALYHIRNKLFNHSRLRLSPGINGIVIAAAALAGGLRDHPFAIQFASALVVGRAAFGGSELPLMLVAAQHGDAELLQRTIVELRAILHTIPDQLLHGNFANFLVMEGCALAAANGHIECVQLLSAMYDERMPRPRNGALILASVSVAVFSLKLSSAWELAGLHPTIPRPVVLTLVAPSCSHFGAIRSEVIWSVWWSAIREPLAPHTAALVRNFLAWTIFTLCCVVVTELVHSLPLLAGMLIATAVSMLATFLVHVSLVRIDDRLASVPNIQAGVDMLALAAASLTLITLTGISCGEMLKYTYGSGFEVFVILTPIFSSIMALDGAIKTRFIVLLWAELHATPIRDPIPWVTGWIGACALIVAPLILVIGNHLFPLIVVLWPTVSLLLILFPHRPSVAGVLFVPTVTNEPELTPSTPSFVPQALVVNNGATFRSMIYWPR